MLVAPRGLPGYVVLDPFRVMARGQNPRKEHDHDWDHPDGWGIVYEEKGVRFSVELEHALVLLCRELDIPVPMWMAKNTHEFAAFHQTIFFSEQYTEKVRFDRFQIKLL